MTPPAEQHTREWLEADGLGGFASGPVAGGRTRRYHAWLLCAEADGSRFAFVQGGDVTVETAAGRFLLTQQAYAGAPSDGPGFLERFEAEPWPRWVYALPDGTRVEAELAAVHRAPVVCLRWRRLSGTGPATLTVRPFFSGRDYHALHHENGAFDFTPREVDGGLAFAPYRGLPEVRVGGNGRYRHQPFWYRRFWYAQEAARGLDCEEDLAAPGEWTFDLGDGPALLSVARGPGLDAEGVQDAFRAERARRAAFPSALHRAADAYVIERGGGKTIIAGYPWFTDWGRDTFIALRGLCLATGRLEEAKAILLRWAGSVSQGMLPNRFPDGGAEPEYNSVDAALWYAVAVHEYLQAATGPRAPSLPERRALVMAVEAILEGHAAGTRFRIGVDADGLLAAGQAGVQLTWMDAKVGDWVVTPRIGKPVEVQALWLNALWVGVQLQVPSDARWRELLERGFAAFERRFWDAQRQRLFDVVDVDHQPGTADPALRPNQVFAVGGLPLPLLSGPRARAVVDAVEAQLMTPLGPRSLGPGEPGYRPVYQGGVWERDGAYHQGTVWPWLTGPFIEAWVRVRGGTVAAQAEARRRFLKPLLAHLEEAGVGHVSEVANAEAPHHVGGCPFQAWSLGELLRLDAALARGARPAEERAPGAAARP